MKEDFKFLQEIKSKLQVIEPEAVIRLFGSRARGDYKLDSDFDLLVLIPDHKWNKSKAEEMEELALNSGLAKGYFVNTIIETFENWHSSPGLYPLFVNVENEAINL
jgi:uncharacterized protein